MNLEFTIFRNQLSDLDGLNLLLFRHNDEVRFKEKYVTCDTAVEL